MPKNNTQMFVMGGLELNGEVPNEFQLMCTGTWKGYPDPNNKVTGVREFTITEDHLKAAVAYNKVRKERNAKRDLLIDYDHSTIHLPPPQPAAGWIGNLEQRGRVLYATDVSWTDKAKAFIASGEYRYISPVFVQRVKDKDTAEIIPLAIFQAALTNEPFLDQLQPIVAHDPKLFTDDAGHTLYLLSQTIKESHMDELLERVRYFLNLPVTSTAQECMAELNKLIDQLKAYASDGTAVTASVVLQWLKDGKERTEAVLANYNTVIGTLGLAATTPIGEVNGRITASLQSAARVQELTTELTTIKQGLFDTRFNGIIEKAIACGRMTPALKADEKYMKAQRAWATDDMDGFEIFITSQAPVVVPLHHVNVTDPPGTGGELTEADKIVASKMGVSEESLKKYNK